MRLGVGAKLFVMAFGAVVLALGLVYAYLDVVSRREVPARVEDELRISAGLLAAAAEYADLPGEPNAEWESLARRLGELARARVTIIRVDGKVLGDSDVSDERVPSLDNHADREEVRQALATGVGVSERFSHTLKQSMLYAARSFDVRGSPFGVVRVALPRSDVTNQELGLRKIFSGSILVALLVAGVAATVAAQVASRAARHLTRAATQMAAGDLAVRINPRGHDELALLGRALDQLAGSLQTSLRELRAERDRLQRVLATMHEGILLLDAEQRVQLVNRAVRELLSLGSDEGIVRRPVARVVRNAAFVEILERARRGPEAAEGEMETMQPSARKLMVYVVPLLGDTPGYLAVFTDVTHLRHLEQVRTQFVANASHELRTPIASIQSAAETLNGPAAGDPKAGQRFAEMILRNANRLRQLVDDLLQLSRIEAKAVELDLAPLAPVLLLQRVRSNLAPMADKHGTEVVVLPAGSQAEHEVIADVQALEQVVTNLLDNAVKYCPGGSRVVLSLAREGDRVLLRVADDGPGIAAEHVSHLFERFYRADPGRSRQLGGTGLGLSIVKHLVESMQGEVRVSSSVGEGSTFVVSLPAASGLRAIAPPRASASSVDV